MQRLDKKEMENMSENKKILNIFNIDKQLLLTAMGKTVFLDKDGSIFNAGKFLNKYLSKNENFDENNFKQYISQYCGLSNWYIDKWWDEVMLNYNLLKKMERQK